MDNHSRYVCFSLADEQINSYANDGTTSTERITNILDMVGYCFPELTERQLCDWLTLGGMDLTDYNEWQICSDYVSWYVGEGAIDLTELNPCTMLSLGSQVRHQGIKCLRMREHIATLKSEGRHFRTHIAPKVEDWENL